jgi:hypothetical protein
VFQGSGLTVTGLDHLEGEAVVVWQDGTCPEDEDGNPRTYTVAGGAIALDTAVTAVACVGLPYTAEFKSAKLAVASSMPLTQTKKLDTLALILADTHNRGIRYGQSFETMDDLPRIEEGAEVDQDQVWEAYDQPAFTVPGEWASDARLCLKAEAPRPATVLAAVVRVTTNE